MSYAAPPVVPSRRGTEPVVGDVAGGSFLRHWAGPIVILFVAAVARLAVLGYPAHLVFDETYYVKDAWSLWHLGYEGSWPDPKGTTANALFEAGHVDIYSSFHEFPAHPPLGKWIIALGEVLAGGAQNSYGWRLSVAVVGILAVALLMWVAHRLFATPLVTMVAGGLFAIDNQAIVMSRVALLDNMVMFFALAAFAMVLEDRFWAERRFGVWLMRNRDRQAEPRWGPMLAWRPWLLAAGATFGLCSGVKWSGIYFLAGFMLYALGSDLFLRRRAGIRFWAPAALLKQAPVVIYSMLPTAFVAYLVCWTGWFVTGGGYDRQYVEDGGARFTGALAWVPVPLQNLWAWTTEIYQFHITLDSPHLYRAPAILWPLIARPTSMWYDASASQCGNSNCVSAIVDLPNPLIWYGAIAATIYLVVRFVGRREWQAGLILMGVAAGYLPWLQYPNRTMFFFYSIAFEPYILLALAATIGLMVMRPPDLEAVDGSGGTEFGLTARRRVVGVFLGVAIVLSAFFYPISAGIPVPYWFWHIHMWSPTWI